MKRSIIFAALLTTGSYTLADAEHGQQLHDEHCMKCHDTAVYTREDRRITNNDALVKQVKRCELNLGLRWFDNDVNDVVQHLNQSFYKFK
ncbi:MAG: cytochrome c [Gammaproteobacteria bacterium]